MYVCEIHILYSKPQDSVLIFLILNYAEQLHFLGISKNKALHAVFFFLRVFKPVPRTLQNNSQLEPECNELIYTYTCVSVSVRKSFNSSLEFFVYFRYKLCFFFFRVLIKNARRDIINFHVVNATVQCFDLPCSSLLNKENKNKNKNKNKCTLDETILDEWK